MFDFSIVTQWIHSMLTSFMPEGLAVFIECVAIGVCIMLAYAVIAIIMIFMERKVCAAFQCRLGPMRVGPWGTIQVFADVFKMLIKEIITIRHADNFLYNLAPYIVILASILSFSCLPFSKGMEVLDFNVGIFFLMAASSIGVVGILLAGWSSNNKYSLIGAMRSGAQMISYELSVGLSILTIVVLTDTMQFSEIVERQADGWFLFKGHIPAMIAFIIYLIAGNAEVNRIFGYALRFILCGRVCQPVHYCRSSRHYLPGRLDAVAYSRLGRLQYRHGLYSRICMVLCKVILYCLAADVDKMDFPSFTYRPDSYTGMEIPGTDRSLQFVADGYYCCI